jgi:hypothetical protein
MADSDGQGKIAGAKVKDRSKNVGTNAALD